ncbi:MAG: hypothetical protein ACJ72V_17255 [Nitrososphaeraceae archaeon]
MREKNTKAPPSGDFSNGTWCLTGGSYLLDYDCKNLYSAHFGAPSKPKIICGGSILSPPLPSVLALEFKKHSIITNKSKQST